MKYILIHKGKVLLHITTEGCAGFPDDIPDGIVCDCSSESFHLDSDTIVPVIQSVGTPPAEMEWVELRAAWALLKEEGYASVTKGAELLFWRTQNLYCGSCGASTQRASEISRVCTGCGREIFPSPAPAILVLITKGEKALLVHARTFSRPFFGLVAGFVESGESLEECVAREVAEETSLKIRNIRYFGSQPWPFPFSLMIGFTAEYADGEIKFADGELSEGKFFDRENPPLLPSSPSLARKMIDFWLNNF